MSWLPSIPLLFFIRSRSTWDHPEAFVGHHKGHMLSCTNLVPWHIPKEIMQQLWNCLQNCSVIFLWGSWMYCFLASLKTSLFSLTWSSWKCKHLQWHSFYRLQSGLFTVPNKRTIVSLFDVMNEERSVREWLHHFILKFSLYRVFLSPCL